MAEFIADFQTVIKQPSISFTDIDSNMELMSQFSGLNPSTTTTATSDLLIDNNHINPNFNFQNFMLFSDDIFFNHQLSTPQLPENFQENYQLVHHYGSENSIVSEPKTIFQEDNKRKALMELSESSSGNSSTLQVSETGIKRKNNSGRGKRSKSKEKGEEEKPREVVHVRARRGQATDSHSLAERVRRGKINERLRCLQDIVPGCYKTMGMAVMLDEIINYIQSLQTQVEFLSMKLTAASTFYDFNSETDAIEKLQRAKAHEARELERLIREGYGGGIGACFHSTCPL